MRKSTRLAAALFALVFALASATPVFANGGNRKCNSGNGNGQENTIENDCDPGNSEGHNNGGG